jgi:hypothetical protein
MVSGVADSLPGVVIEPAPPLSTNLRAAWWARYRSELVVLAGFLVSRATILVGFTFGAWIQTDVALRDLFQQWDVRWYVSVVRDGYGAELQPGRNNLAFFPLFPRLIDALARVSGLDLVTVGMLMNFVLGAVFTVLMYRLGLRLLDSDTAVRATLLMVFFPGSLFLFVAYSEALMLVLAAACLLALLDQQWVRAGMWAALAGLTRPNGVVLTLVCAVAVVEAVRRERVWRSVWAVALAPLGFGGYLTYVAVRTQDLFGWFRIQREGWGERFDFGWTNVLRAVDSIPAPLRNWNNTLAAIGLVVLGIGVVLLLRWRPPAIITAYTLGMVALAVGSATIGGRPRFVLVAFPLFYAFARVLRGHAYPVALAGSGCALMLFAVSFTEKVLVIP